MPESTVTDPKKEENSPNLTQTITIKDEMIWSGIAIACMALFLVSFGVTIFYVRKQSKAAEAMTYSNKPNPPHEAFIIDDTGVQKSGSSTTVV